MNLLFMANNGLPRNGLVTLYDPYRDTYGRNVLPVGSDNFANAGYPNGWYSNDYAAITVTGGQPDPDGGNNAFRIQSSGGHAQTKYNIIASVGLISGYFSIWSKKNNDVGTILRDDMSSGGTRYLTNTWTKYTLNSTENPKPAFGVVNIADGLDIMVYQPQLNIGALYPYFPPQGPPQSAVDYTGRGNNAQNGSTASTDTNDAAWSGVALVHTTNHYQLTSAISALDMSNFSMLVAGKFAGTNGAITSLAAPSVTNKYQGVKYVSSGNLAIISCNAGTESVSSNLAVSTTDNVFLLFTASGGTLTLKNLSTGASVTLTDTAPTGTPRIGMGCVAGSTVAQIASALTWYNVAPYSRVLTTAEVARAYADLKRRNNVKGVVIA